MNKTIAKAKLDYSYKEAYDRLLELADGDMLKEVMSQKGSELEPGFLGFIDNYYNALRYIPEKDFIILDIGCYLGIQSCFFGEYNGYIGVDPARNPVTGKQMKKYLAKNAMYFNEPGQEFIKNRLHMLNIDKTFVIMSAVPDEALTEEVIKTFKYYYIAYPGKETMTWMDSN